MRVVHVCVTDNGNGADMAAYRAHRALLQNGVDSTIFIANQVADFTDSTKRGYKLPESFLGRARIFAYRRWITNKLARYTIQRNYATFLYDWAVDGPRAVSQIPAADVIFVHSAYGFIAFQDFSLLAKRAHLVFVLRDMSCFTGGCTHDRGCGRFTDHCGSCPLLQSHNEYDLSRELWKRKHTAFSRMRGRVHFIAPSRWIAREARRSSLLKDYPISVIPNSVDTEVLRPQNQSAMRELFGIPQGMHVVGFLSDPLDRAVKGFPALAKALSTMKDTRNLFLVTAGGGKPPAEVGIPHLHVGRIHDSRLLCAFYSALDIVALPSLSDNLPSVVIEAMACGIPIVAFNVGGVSEMVRDGDTGLLVPAGDTEAFGEAVARLLQTPSARARMAENGRKMAVEEYSMLVQAKRYTELCTTIGSLPSTTMPRSVAETNTPSIAIE